MDLDLNQTPSPHAHKTLWLIIGVLLLVVLVGSVYWWKEIKTVDKLQVTADSKKDLTADWETYKDNFVSFKYPPSYQLDNAAIQNQHVVVLGYDHYGLGGLNFSRDKSLINLFINHSKGETAETIKQSHQKDISPADKIEVLKVNGLDAVRLFTLGGPHKPTWESIIIPTDTVIYTWDFSDIGKDTEKSTKVIEFEQLVSTFKFTDSTLDMSPPAGGWKTYTNSQYGFSVSIPPDWTVTTPKDDTDPLAGVLDFLSAKTRISADKNCKGPPNDCNPEQLPYDMTFSTKDQSASEAILDTTSKEINGIKFTIYHEEGLFDYYIYQTMNNGKVYSFALFNQDDAAAILSSFKFTK